MTTQFGGYMDQALWVDLTTQTTRPFVITDRDRTALVGNKGVAAKILWDHLAPHTDPLGPDNLLVVTTSPVTGTGAPCTSRFNISTKSPLTFGITSTNSGGNFGTLLKRAGYDALILSGRSERPVYLEVTPKGVVFHDAGHLWGLDTEATQEKLSARHGKQVGRLVIGPAGEHLVRYACIVSNERVNGRGGVGAVMGSKLLKAVVAYGPTRPRKHDARAFEGAARAWSKLLRRHPATGTNLPRFGTAGLVALTNALGLLPTRNFSAGTFDGALATSGETLAETLLVRNEGCRSCPIRCARVVEIDGKHVKGPEYETVGLLGANLNNPDLARICRWNYLMDKLGMDTISAAGSIAFATELTERGLLESPLSWSQVDHIEEVVRAIAYRDGIGDLLAEGTLRMAERVGGKAYAIHAKGMELAAYEPRRSVGHGLGYATAPRGGCHLQGGYMAFFENLGPITVDPQVVSGKAGLALFQQDSLEAISAGGFCIFTSYAVLPPLPVTISPAGTAGKVFDLVLRGSSRLLGALGKAPTWVAPLHLPGLNHAKIIETTTGMRMKVGEFIKLGTRSFTLEHMFNIREGLVDNTLPSRLTDEPQVPTRDNTRVPLRALLADYFQQRGWDDRGIPRRETLADLGLGFTTSALPEGGQNVPEIYAEFLKCRREQDAAAAGLIAFQRSRNEALYAQRQGLEATNDRAFHKARAAAIRGAVFAVDAALCQRCGRCATACPVAAITWHKGEVAVIRQETCIACGKCHAACPPMFLAITMTPDVARTAERSAIAYRVDEVACKKCGICAQKCPVQCIAWAKKEVARIDEELCVRCGLCAQVCPPKFDAVRQVSLAS